MGRSAAALRDCGWRSHPHKVACLWHDSSSMRGVPRRRTKKHNLAGVIQERPIYEDCNGEFERGPRSFERCLETWSKKKTCDTLRRSRRTSDPHSPSWFYSRRERILCRKSFFGRCTETLRALHEKKMSNWKWSRIKNRSWRDSNSETMRR